MRKIILALGSAAETAFAATSMILLLILMSYIAGDVFFPWLSGFNRSSVITAGKEIAGAGVLAAIIAFSYFLLRTGIVFMSKRKVTLPPGLDGTLKTILAFLRMTHPTIGACAIALLAAHGYTILRYELAGGIDPLSVSGSAALAAGFTLLIAGMLLSCARANSAYRKIHRLIAIICVITAAAHIIVVSIIG